MREFLNRRLRDINNTNQITVSNKCAGNVIANSTQNPSTLKIDGVDYYSGQSIYLDTGRHTSKANQERFANYQSKNIKHINWDGVSTSIFLTDTFQSSPSVSYRIANYADLKYSKIEVLLEGSLITSKGDFEFYDPWYVKGDSTQPGDYWIPCTSSYEPTGKDGAAEKGVFLNQGATGFTPPYYSVKMASPQTIALSNSSHKFYFQGWQSTKNANGTPKAEFKDAHRTETGVVFKNDSAVVSAVMKGTQLTSTASSLSNNSQRKIVRTPDGFLHFVYESMNTVWYEMSTDNGVTWNIMNGGKALSYGPAKNPSIDMIPDYSPAANHRICIAYQDDLDIWGRMIALTEFCRINGVYTNMGTATTISTSAPFSENLDPVVAGVWYDKSIGIAWVNKDDSLPNLPKSIAFNAYSRQTDGTLVQIGTTFSVPNSGALSKHPAITSESPVGEGGGDPIFHIVWEEQTQNGTSSQIRYTKVIAQATGVSERPNAYQVLAGGFRYNSLPSITNLGLHSRVVWLTEEEPYTGDSQVLQFRDPENQSRAWYFGRSVSSPTITKQAGNSYFIGWSQQYENTWQNYWVRNTLSINDIYQIGDANGRYMQLTNNGTLGNTRTVILTGSSAPFAFATVPIFDENVPRGIVAAGVQGAVNYAEGGGVSFEFNLGDVTNDGDPVSFVEADPNYYINTVTELNEYLTTVPFTVSNSSEFFYSVSYSCSNPEIAAQVFADGGGVLFKIELLDDNTSEVLAVYDSVFYSASNTGEHDNILYQVNCQGIGNRTVRLQVQTFVVPGDPMLGQMMSPLGGDEGGMNKIQGMSKTEQMKFWKANGVVTRKNSKEKAMTFRGEFLENGETASRVTEYELEQNYPNPFNPETWIQYSVPSQQTSPFHPSPYEGEGNDRVQSGLRVRLSVYDILGREVATLVNEEKTAGRYTVSFNASSLPSGTYFYELRAGDYRAVRKMSVIK